MSIFLVSLFQRIKLKLTVLHPNNCRRAAFFLSVESWPWFSQWWLRTAAECLNYHRQDEDLNCSLPSVQGASMEHWLLVQNTVTSSLVTCLLLPSLVVHHCVYSMLPSLLPSLQPLAATSYSLSSKPLSNRVHIQYFHQAEFLCQAVSLITGEMSSFGSGAHP